MLTRSPLASLTHAPHPTFPEPNNLDSGRRTFLTRLAACAGLTLCGCATLGVAAPHGQRPAAASSAQRTTEPQPQPQSEPQPATTASDRRASTGDAELDDLHQLAGGPMDELIRHRLVFLVSLCEHYRSDVVLWRGVERLCNAVMEGESIPDRRLFARVLAQVIERADQPFASALQSRIASLRSQS